MTDEITRSIRPEWSMVLDKMLLVNLTVTRWRAATRAEFNEFGLDAKAFQAYTAGSRHLLPRDMQMELDALESMARDLLKKFSYRTLFGYMVPKEQYFQFKDWIETKPAASLRRYLHGKRSLDPSWDTTSLKDRWFALAQEIADHRDQIVDQVVDAYRPSAIVRWRVENGLAKDADTIPDDGWLDDTLAAMVNRIPTASQIRDSFTLEIAPAFVEAPDEAIKAAKLEEIEAQQREVERRLDEISHAYVESEKRKAWAEARTAEEAMREEVHREEEKTRLALLAEKETLERERRITEEIIAHEKKLKEERISTTLNEVAGQLHTLVYSAVCDGLSYLNDPKHEALHPRYVGRLKRLVEEVRLLNFTDDPELTRVCDQLERLAEENAASKDSAGRARDLLKDVGISLKADLVAAAIPSRSARDLGIPDDPMPELVRKARRLEAKPLDAALESPELIRNERSKREALAEVSAPAA